MNKLSIESHEELKNHLKIGDIIRSGREQFVITELHPGVYNFMKVRRISNIIPGYYLYDMKPAREIDDIISCEKSRKIFQSLSALERLSK
jgi:hypothetical protein